MTKTDCIFCKIIDGEIPVVKIFEDKKYFAFLDMNPINPGHTLLIPKKHTDYLFDLSDDEYSELMLKAKHLAKILKNKLKSKKIGLIVEGFGVSHVHIHLVPINSMGELNQKRTKPMNKEELNRLAEKITG
ncbi:MAG TPA: HIT family protein [Candidatus Nanoarchaeia archaeon]|nr:HIT family protein [Candidatus Nanoarchaeia archaeon]